MAKPLKEIINEITKKHSDVEEIKPIAVSRISLADWISLKCQYGCTMYGKSWSCPPATPSMEKAAKILREYRTALFIRMKYTRGKEKSGKRKPDKTILDIEKRLFLGGYYKAFAFFVSPCSYCKLCSYPGPCKHPDMKRPTSESIGIDIFRTARNIGIQLRILQKKEPFTMNTLVLVE